MSGIRIEMMEEGHWPAVRAIYAEGIAGGEATFETEPPEWPPFAARFDPAARLVATADGAVAGWAALAPVSARPVYRGVMEVSVYVAADRQGQGVGRALMSGLIDAARAAGCWTLQASVFPENAATLALHARFGFRLVGRRERIAQLNGRWRDTLLLERRERDP
jgi:L-amino acid N-acyltransferase YncA